MNARADPDPAGIRRVALTGGDPARASCRVRIEAELPGSIALGEVAQVSLTVENLSDVFLASAEPNPTEVCYRWFDADGAAVGHGTWLHTRLPRTVAPADRVRVVARVEPPPVVGRFTLRLTLLQEGVHWFDDVDPSNAASAQVDIVERAQRDADTNVAYGALRPDERRALAGAAAAVREPLRARWAIMNRQPDGWHHRTAAAAAWLSAASSVADLGCGSMALERHLAREQRYVPVDLIARDERTVVLDLEKDDLSPAAADACALLGVLGYLYDPASALRKIRTTFARAVVSYNVRPEMEIRLANGWVNHLDHATLLRLFETTGFTVVRELALTKTQWLFDLARAGRA